METSGGTSVSIRGLTKRFNSQVRHRNRWGLGGWLKDPPRTIFENLHFEIPAGQKVILTGPNGSGKTTFLKLLAGLLPYETGQISIVETPLTNLPDTFYPQPNWVPSVKHQGTPPSKLRHRIGLVLCFEMLYLNLSGRENLEFAARAHQIPNPTIAVKNAAKHWGLTDHLPAAVTTYSYGLKARLNLARATLHHPSLLLLDEPTIALDEVGNLLLLDYLKSSPATAIIATHQPEIFKELCPRIVALNPSRPGAVI